MDAGDDDPHPSAEKRTLRPADTSDDGTAPEADGGPTPVIRRVSEADQESNVAGSLSQYDPLEPQEIDLENAVFVLLGVVFLIGFLVLAIQGL